MAYENFNCQISADGRALGVGVVSVELVDSISGDSLSVFGSLLLSFLIFVSGK